MQNNLAEGSDRTLQQHSFESSGFITSHLGTLGQVTEPQPPIPSSVGWARCLLPG